MKKSVLSIVAIAFAAVSVLSSCDKNDDGYGQSAKPQTTVTTQTTTQSVNQQTKCYDQYTIVFKYIGTEDSKLVENVMLDRTFTGTADEAINEFETLYKNRLSDLHAFVSARAKKVGDKNAIIKCTLAGPDGEELERMDVDPCLD